MKTQFQILERLRTYENKTVESPYRITKRTSYDDRYAAMEVGAIDFDKSYHAQCADLILDYVYWFTDKQVRPTGDARDFINTNYKGYFKIIKNTPNYLPPVGAIAVYREGTPGYLKYGHINIVYKNPTLDTFVCLEQNWNNKANLPPTARVDNYYGVTHFIVPVTKENIVSGDKKVNKKKILLVAGHGLGYWSNDSGAAANGYTERDFIRKNIIPNVAKHLRDIGHDVHLYGGSTMNQDLFQDTRYGEMVGNYSLYGMYWVARQKFDTVVEFHLDAASPKASGGHVIIGAGLVADTLDKAIQNTISNFIGVIRGIDPRNNLLNVNVAKQQGVNYRLVELGFITSVKDMNNIISQLHEYTLSIAEDIHGGKLKPVKKPVKDKVKSTAKNVVKKVVQPKPKPVAAGKPAKPKTEWDWSGVFTTFARNSDPIIVRRGVGLKEEKVDSDSWIYPNQWVPFDKLIKKDGYWWIRFEYPTNPKAGKFYMPIGKIGKTGKVLADKTLWGILNVKKRK